MKASKGVTSPNFSLNAVYDRIQHNYSIFLYHFIRLVVSILYNVLLNDRVNKLLIYFLPYNLHQKHF